MSAPRVLHGVCGCLIVAAMLGGCAQRQVEDADSGSSAVDTSGVSGGTTTEPNPSSPATTVTSGSGTTETTPTTGDPSTDDPGDTETTWKLDLPDQPNHTGNGPPGLKGCTKHGPEGPGVEGESALGQFFGTRAYFGYKKGPGGLEGVRLLVLDDTADLELAFSQLSQEFGDVTIGPALQVQPSPQFDPRDPFWSGEDMNAALVVHKDNEEAVVLAKVSIVGHAGDWDVATPDDPPRLLGTIEPGDGAFAFVGEFDAVFCDLLVIISPQ